MDTPIDLLMYLRTIIYWFTTWTASQIIQSSTHFTTNYELLRAAAHTACIALTKACGGRDRWRHTVLIRHIKRFNKTVHIHTRAYTQTHTQTKWCCVRVCYRCRCMGAFNVLFGWLADCVDFLVTVSFQCTPNTTHKNETRNPNERENMYEWKVNNHRKIIEIWILASNSLGANVYILFMTYVY